MERRRRSSSRPWSSSTFSPSSFLSGDRSTRWYLIWSVVKVKIIIILLQVSEDHDWEGERVVMTDRYLVFLYLLLLPFCIWYFWIDLHQIMIHCDQARQDQHPRSRLPSWGQERSPDVKHIFTILPSLPLGSWSFLCFVRIYHDFKVAAYFLPRNQFGGYHCQAFLHFVTSRHSKC